MESKNIIIDRNLKVVILKNKISLSCLKILLGKDYEEYTIQTSGLLDFYPYVETNTYLGDKI